MNAKHNVREVYCAFRMGSTQEDGTHGLPNRCASKGCKGGPFNKDPMCETFRRDPTMIEQKPALVVEFSEIRAAREKRRHEFIFKHTKPVIEQPVLKVAKA